MNRLSARRATGRVNGRMQNSPTTSVTKPGVSSSVPPTRISAPSASSRAGIRRLVERLLQRRPGPAALVLHQPAAQEPVGDQQQDRPPGADDLADLDEHVDLDDRQHDEQQRRAPTTGSVVSSLLLAGHCSRVDVSAFESTSRDLTTTLAQTPRW